LFRYFWIPWIKTALFPEGVPISAHFPFGGHPSVFYKSRFMSRNEKAIIYYYILKQQPIGIGAMLHGKIGVCDVSYSSFKNPLAMHFSIM
jgi:hypothetical protein